MRANAPGEVDFFTRLLGSVAVREEAKVLEIPDPLDRPHLENGLPFSLNFPLLLEGQLAQLLYQGGAYGGGMRGAAPEAKKLAEGVRVSLFGDRYEEVLVYESDKPWCRWFCGVAWDSTTIVFDKRTRRIWLLCCTDTDLAPAQRPSRRVGGLGCMPHAGDPLMRNV